MNTLALLLAAGVLAACGDTTDPAEPFFGAHYDVVLQPESPVLASTFFTLTVSYGGCRDNHDFLLRYRIRSDTAEIWLRKTTPDETCDMLVTERRAFALPDPVREAVAVTLIAPEIEPYQLRP